MLRCGAHVPAVAAGGPRGVGLRAMEVQRWAQKALEYLLASGRLRAVGRATGRVDVLGRAEALSAMANGYLAIGFEEVAAASRGGEPAAAIHQARGRRPGEGER
jgi:hypothetical protein